MAAKNNVEFKVGIIILIGIVILFGSLYWLQGYKLERNSRQIKVRFDDVGSLAIGDKVTVSGVHKGKVNAFYLTDDGVLVELLLHRDVVLKRDATFRIQNLGVMGERFIAISPGSDSLQLDSTMTAAGAYDTGIPEIMGLLGTTITELRDLISSFKENVQTESTLVKFNNTLANLEDVTFSMAGYMKRNESRLDKTAENVYDASRQINALLTANSGKIDSTVQRFDRASDGLERFVGQLDTIAVALRNFTDAMETQEGTIQLLVEDRRLYDDLRRTVDNIDDLVQDIRANPRKYINLEVKLF